MLMPCERITLGEALVALSAPFAPADVGSAADLGLFTAKRMN